MTFTSSPGFSLMLEGISYMIGAEVPGVFVERHARRTGARQHRARAVRHQAGLPWPRSRQHPRDRPGSRLAAGDARLHHAGLRAGLRVPQPGGDRRRRLPRPDDRQGASARPHARARDPGVGRRRGPVAPRQPDLLDRPRGGRTSSSTIMHLERQVRAHAGAGAAGRPLPLRRRRRRPRRVQHPGPAGQGRGEGAARLAASAWGCSARSRCGRSRSTRCRGLSTGSRHVVVVEASERAAGGRAAPGAQPRRRARPAAISHVRRQGGVLPSQDEIVEHVAQLEEVH